MNKLYKSFSIKTKINLSNIVISFIVLILLSMISLSISREYLIKNVRNSNYQNLKLIGEKFDIVFDNVENATKIAVTNPRIQNAFGDSYSKDRLSSYQTLLTMNQIIEDMIEPWTLVQELIIYDRLGNVYQSDELTSKSINHINDNVFDMKGTTSWIFGVGNDRYDNNELRFRRLFYNYNTGEKLGVIDAIITEQEINNIYSNVTLGKTGYIFIEDIDGHVVSHKDKSLIGKSINEIDEYILMLSDKKSNNLIITIGQDKYIVTRYEYEKFQWTIYGIVPVSEVIGDLHEISQSIILAWLICVIISIILSGILSRSLTKPLKELTGTISCIGNGDIEARANIVNNDEIGILANEFNKMANEVSDLMARIELEQDSKRKLEVAMLQAQINPHFLYNTIDNICGLALMNRNSEIVTVMKSLSKFYRGVLSSGSTIVPISREIETTINYLKIMKMRYGTKFDYEISIDEELYEYSILKMTLQPILENAIYHGIRSKLDNGFIKIYGTIKNGHVELIIEDDGIGMNQDFADNILINDKNRVDGQSFGLKCTDDRLKIYFGSQYGLRIKSKENIGTKLIISLPTREYTEVLND